MSASQRDETEGKPLPVRVIEHEGVVTSEPRGLSEGERGLVGWMEDHEPDEADEADESEPDDSD